MASSKRLFTALFASSFLAINAVSQITQPVVPPPTTGADFKFKFDPSPDPAMRHNRLLQERTGDGVYTQVGNFKVSGSPYLFWGRNKGDLFSKSEKALNIFLSYNTYNQELGFYSTSNPTNMLVKTINEVDSFIIHADASLHLAAPQKFVNGKLIGSKEESYYQEILAGTKYSIYKKYKSDLGYVSSNYVQSELRQFDLQVEYYYVGEDKKMKKIKANTFNVVKEFKALKDVSGLIPEDAFTLNADESFKKVFAYLNQ